MYWKDAEPAFAALVHESECQNLPEHYHTDLYVVDRDTIKNRELSRFAFCFRNNGTHIYFTDGGWDNITAWRDCILRNFGSGNDRILFYVYQNEELTAVDGDRLPELWIKCKCRESVEEESL